MDDTMRLTRSNSSLTSSVNKMSLKSDVSWNFATFKIKVWYFKSILIKLQTTTTINDFRKSLGLPEEAAAKKSKSPKKAAAEKPESPKKTAAKKPKSPKKTAAKKPESPKKAAAKKPESPKKAAAKKPESPKKAAAKKPKSSKEAATTEIEWVKISIKISEVFVSSS